MLAPLGVASNCAVNEPFWLANAVFCHAVELVVHAPGCITVTADVPFLPSLVAVIVAEPAATPVTSPLPLTVATPVLLLDQVTTRPDNGVPFASFGVAVSCSVSPTVTVAGEGVTVTLATGTWVTVTLDVPLCPSLVAVMVAVPATTPVTSPLPFTLATAVLLLDQVTTRPLSGFPLASFGVAVSCTVAPCCTLAGDGLTVTDATGMVDTVTNAVPLCPSLVAVMVAVPVAIAVTNPFPSTVATAVLLLDQVTTRPESGVPFASFGVAVSCTVWPACTVGAAGLTLTKATGATQVTVTVAVSVAPSGWLLAATLTVPHALAW